MVEEQVFCGAERCSNHCPAHIGSDFTGVNCRIVNIKVKAERAKKEAYEKMLEYYSLKITNNE